MDLEVTVTMCGYLDNVVPISVRYTRTPILRRIGYVLYWTEPIDRYGFQVTGSHVHSHRSTRRFWTMRAAQLHARDTAPTIQERVAREADYYGLAQPEGEPS